MSTNVCLGSVLRFSNLSFHVVTLAEHIFDGPVKFMHNISENSWSNFVLFKAYQFLLKRYNLGIDPKAEDPASSPFMKLEMSEDDLKAKKFFELDLDADVVEELDENNEAEEEDEEPEDETFDDDVFGNLTAQIQGCNL